MGSKGVQPGTVKCMQPLAVLARHSSNYYPKPPPGYHPPTMDDLPIPCGDWYTDYMNKQRKYNIQLLLSGGLFVISLFASYFTGVFECPASFPSTPAPRPTASC